MCGKDAHCPHLLAHFVSSSFPIQVVCCGYFFVLLLPLVDCCGIFSSHLHNWFFVFCFWHSIAQCHFFLSHFFFLSCQCHNATLQMPLSGHCSPDATLWKFFLFSPVATVQNWSFLIFYNVIFWIMEILCCLSVSTNIELACIMPPTMQALSQKNQQSNNAVGGNSKFLEIGNLAAGWP